MRKLLLLLLLLLPLSAVAQYTSVSGQVTDTGGVAWANGTFKFVFQGPTSATLQGVPSWNPLAPITGTLTSGGAIPATNVPDNSLINPPRTQWQLQVCSNTYPQVCSYLITTITGASQTVNSTPAAIQVPVSNTPGIFVAPTLYADAEISGGWVNYYYYNINSALFRVCQAISGGQCSSWANMGGGGGGGTPGGINGQIQYNNSGSFGGFTASGDCTITPGTGAVVCTKTNGVAFGALATAGYPGAGIANSTGSGWGTSLTTTGSGTVVALAASPVLTGTPDASGAAQIKLPVGAGFATIANGEVGYDTTNKNWHVWQNGADVLLVPLASGFTSGHCPQPTSTGGVWQLADAGAACGSGGGSGTVNASAQYNSTYYSGAGSSTTVSGMAWLSGYDGVPQIETETTSGGVQAVPVASPGGVTPNPQVGTTYTVALTDRLKYLSFSNASAIAVTLPQAGTAGFDKNFAFVGCDIGAGTATITPTTSTISYSTGSGYTSGASSMALGTGTCAWIYTDNSNYFAIKFIDTSTSGLSGMTAGQVAIAGSATTITSSKAIQGTDSAIMSAGTVSGTGATLCTDANGGATTTGCSGGGGTISGQVVGQVPLPGSATSITATLTAGTNQGYYNIVRANTTQGTAASLAETQVGDCASPGTVTGAGTTYTVAYTDVVGCVVRHDIAGSAGATITIPTPTTLNNAHPIFVYENDSNQTDTLSPTTFTISLSHGTAASTLSVPSQVSCKVQVDPVNGSTWKADCHPIQTSNLVASVSNSDGTLTISPTTGAVVASLALGHANTWTAAQTVPTLNTSGNCAAAGSAANPSAVACGSAAAGRFSCATNASTGTCVVSTTAVTANSIIQIEPDSTLGAALSVTCNTSMDTGLTAPRVSARSAGTSFTITLGTFATNPECFSYIIVN